MSTELTIGLILFTGFIFGEIFKWLGFPKVTGYILAGIFLNPGLFNIIPPDFSKNTDVVIHIALAIITFSVGGTLQQERIRKVGKSLLTITIFEAETAFFFVAIFFFLITALLLNIPVLHSLAACLAFSLLLAVFASPTDPTATLAVIDEYKCHGKLSTMIMGVAAFDDTVAILNFSLFTAIAKSVMGVSDGNLIHSILVPLYAIGGATLLGIFGGYVLNMASSLLKKETDGILIVVISAFLITLFGIAKWIGVDELLTTMTFGIFVVNKNPLQKKYFSLMERYTEELIFLLFFTVSGMQLNFGVLASSWLLILLFFIFRAMGKYTGTWMGANITYADPVIKRYTAFGLLPQGGIVIGMSLLLKKIPVFDSFTDIIISVIIGATIIHEILGPVLSKFALRNAGEIK